MKNNKVKKVIIGVIIIAVVVILLLSGLFLLKYMESNKVQYVEKENVQELVTKFNNEVTNSKVEYLATEDSFIAEDEFYWYGLYEDVVLHVVPVKYSGDLNTDIVLEMGIFYDKGSANEEMAMNYLANLIKANVNTLTDEEIKDIIKQSKEIGKDNINAKKGTGYANYGLVVTYWDNEDNYHYSVEREMEPENEKNS